MVKWFNGRGFVIKKLLSSLLLVFCSVSLIACQPQNEEMTLGSISEISISISNGYGGLNENYFLLNKQEETISSFEVILKNAKEIRQDVNVNNEKPDYDILIRYENDGTQGLHLLLGNVGEESIIMFIGHEENGYIVSPKDTNELRKLLDV
mgnify:FL=1